MPLNQLAEYSESTEEKRESSENFMNYHQEKYKLKDIKGMLEEMERILKSKSNSKNKDLLFYCFKTYALGVRNMMRNHNEDLFLVQFIV